ncbi:MAG TPA: hypothetical protein VM142_12690, partial [Acidimicrobiales bacterium]|nr:hypothetical protein [Acidimicrobiales bacterium]
MFSTFVSWLVTTRPTRAELAIASVVVPTVVQLLPFDETKPVTVDPERTSFNHAGVGWDVLASQSVDPPFVERVMNSMLPPGFKSRITCAAFAAVDARSITPALAYELVLS